MRILVGERDEIRLCRQYPHADFHALAPRHHKFRYMVLAVAATIVGMVGACTLPAPEYEEPSTPQPAGRLGISYMYLKYYKDLWNWDPMDFWDAGVERHVEKAFEPANIEIFQSPKGLLELSANSLRESDLELVYNLYPPDYYYPYGVYGASRVHDANGYPMTGVMGLSYDSPDPPGTAAALKYCFVFVKNIEDNGGGELFDAVTIHGLGHIRASLKHPLDEQFRYDGYHVEEYDIEFSYCVMHQLDQIAAYDPDPKTPSVNKVLKELSFCGVGRDTEQTHCIHFLMESNE